MPGCVKPANADVFPVVASLGGRGGYARRLVCVPKTHRSAEYSDKNKEQY